MPVPMFIISCKDSLDRREHIASQSKSLDLPWEFVDAVDMRRASYADIEDVYDCRKASHHNLEMVPAEVGCYLSHLKVYELMRERGIARAVVAEDDFCLRPECDAKRVIEALADESMQWDVVQLGVNPTRHPPISRYYATPVLGSLHISRFLHSGTGAYFYMIDRSYADELLEWHRQHKIFLPIDVMLFDMRYALRFAHILCGRRGRGRIVERRLAGHSGRLDSVLTAAGRGGGPSAPPPKPPRRDMAYAIASGKRLSLKILALPMTVAERFLLKIRVWFACGQAWNETPKLNYLDLGYMPTDRQVQQVYISSSRSPSPT